MLDGGWNIADCVARSYDVKGMHIGTVAAGLTFHADAAAMVPHCDVVTVNPPLHPQTEGCSATS